MQLPFSQPSFSKLLVYQLAATLMSVSLLPLTTSCTLVKQSKGVETNINDLQSQQRQHNLKESKISQLIEILEQKSRLYELKASPEALAASQELVEIGKPAVPELINAFSKNRIFLTFGVAETLLKIAQKDSSVVPILINKLGDKDLQVRFGAMKALENDSFVPELKNDLSKAELEKAISDLETALKTIENSEHEIPQHIASTLRRSLSELKK